MSEAASVETVRDTMHETAQGTMHEALQQRISEMQPLRLDDRTLPTAAPLRPLLPGGALRAGASYSVQGSRTLALSLLAETSASGAWCGIIGMPEFGAEAAAALGVALDRCILIPEPGTAAGSNAIALAGSLTEILSLVLLRPSHAPQPSETERLHARLREHECALIATSEWPRTESALRVTGSRWHGLEPGHGLLEAREMQVEARDRRGTHTHTVRFEGGRVVENVLPTPIAPIRGADHSTAITLDPIAAEVLPFAAMRQARQRAEHATPTRTTPPRNRKLQPA